MPVKIGVPKEEGKEEKRVALSPEIATKFIALGAEVFLEKDAGLASYWADNDYKGVKIVKSSEEIFSSSDLILTVRRPRADLINAMAEGKILIGYLRPYEKDSSIDAMLTKKISSYSVELVPRISRAQAMDALSSQAAIAGYQAVIIAAGVCPKFFPMITYAAGSIRPARVLVIGAGVAGLQAIATAKRLGAVVEAYDVRPTSKEEVESLGAKFVDTGILAAGSGGYARELSEEEKAKQASILAGAVARSDVLITTAAIPGRRSPLIVNSAMLNGMRAGSVVVDLAAEGGGNVEGSKAGETLVINGITIIGPTNVPSKMSINASEMYSRNLYSFVSPFLKEGNLNFNIEDQVISASCLCRGGQIVNEAAAKALGGK